MNSPASELSKLYSPDRERVGFVLVDGSIVEVENICEKPELGFDVKGEDIAQFMPVARGTWHTHPDATKNLSMKDFDTFMDWPDHQHWIVGTDGVRRYWVEDGELLQDDEA